MSEVKGEVGFKETNLTDCISKEETMFRIDSEGKALPMRIEIQIYDRDLDMELMDESLRLTEALKKQKAIKEILAKLVVERNKDLADMETKIKAEEDKIQKLGLTNSLENMKKVQETGDIKSNLNAKMIEASLVESREIIKHLNRLKSDSIKVNFIEAIPCTVVEAMMAFELHKTIDNRDTVDWIADVISRKCVKPSYTLEEAKLLKLDYKLAIKDALMRLSNYKVISYRDIISEESLRNNKPLTAKK